MRRLLNTLFVTSEDAYLTLDGENIVVRREKEEAGRFPLHNLEEIVSFSYAGASPALMGACTRRNIGLSFCTPSGRFLARTAGVENGNVLLRREQYRVADDPAASCQIAKLMIWGKLYNGRWSIERTKRDHKLRIDAERFENASAAIRDILPQVMEAGSLDSLRGLEGAAASVYFEVFDDMILRWTMSMQCSPFPTVCWPEAALPRWRASVWMPMSAFCTGIVPAEHRLRWTLWRSCGRAWRTGLC